MTKVFTSYPALTAWVLGLLGFAGGAGFAWLYPDWLTVLVFPGAALLAAGGALHAAHTRPQAVIDNAAEQLQKPTGLPGAGLALAFGTVIAAGTLPFGHTQAALAVGCIAVWVAAIAVLVKLDSAANGNVSTRWRGRGRG